MTTARRYCRNQREIDLGEDWRDQAACKGQDFRLFFPETTGNGSVQATAGVVTVFCSHCPVQTQCAETAFRNKEHGIWGGLNEKQRRAMRSARRSVTL